MNLLCLVKPQNLFTLIQGSYLQLFALNLLNLRHFIPQYLSAISNLSCNSPILTDYFFAAVSNCNYYPCRSLVQLESNYFFCLGLLQCAVRDYQDQVWTCTLLGDLVRLLVSWLWYMGFTDTQ